MRKLLIATLLVVLVVGGAAAFLHLTTPDTSEGVRFPLTDEHLGLLRRVPASAESFALVPAAAAVYTKMQTNPITSDALGRFRERQPLPEPWMLGGADIVVWRVGKQTTYSIRLDPLRALLIRTYLFSRGDMDERGSAVVFLINSPSQEEMGKSSIDELVKVTTGLPAGDALVVQRGRSSGAYPPLPRPAATSVKIEPGEILLTSRALRSETNEYEGRTVPRVVLPDGALIAGAFTEPPRVLNDLNRLLGGTVTPLLADGGGIVIFDVRTGTLLPRIEGTVVLPATPERRAALSRFADRSYGFVEVGEAEGQLLMAFDDKSIGRFRAASHTAPLKDAVSTLRIDAPRLVPIVAAISENPAIRLATPRIHRSARELHQWIGALERVQSVDAVLTRPAGAEELRVRLVAK